MFSVRARHTGQRCSVLTETSLSVAREENRLSSLEEQFRTFSPAASKMRWLYDISAELPGLNVRPPYAQLFTSLAEGEGKFQFCSNLRELTVSCRYAPQVGDLSFDFGVPTVTAHRVGRKLMGTRILVGLSDDRPCTGSKPAFLGQSLVNTVCLLRRSSHHQCTLSAFAGSWRGGFRDGFLHVRETPHCGLAATLRAPPRPERALTPRVPLRLRPFSPAAAYRLSCVSWGQSRAGRRALPLA